MSRQEFRRWVEARPHGRFERIDGLAVAMALERLVHVRVKARAWRALDDAVRAAGLDCEVFADGADQRSPHRAFHFSAQNGSRFVGQPRRLAVAKQAGRCRRAAAVKARSAATDIRNLTAATGSRSMRR